MNDRLTILVAARDAEATIERAIRSCLEETSCPLILVDDHCTDATVARARGVAGRRLRVLQAPDPGGVGTARQCGLEAVDTEWAAWVDADDEWVPGRAAHLTAALSAGADVAVDAFDLHDGLSAAWLNRLTPPPFLRRPGGAVRLFERNWLPGDTPVAFRTAVFRQAGGYDAAIHGPESYDVLLRSIANGATFAWSEEVGYRIYAYASSTSRNVTRQRSAVAAALRKHRYETIASLYEQAGYSRRIGAWALVSVALFRGETAEALRFLDEACPPDTDPEEVLEADGPWPFREGWRRAFARGVALLLTGTNDAEALECLRLAEALEPTAEGANNLGVALSRAGRLSEAHEAWAAAAGRFPGYADGASNARGGAPLRITTHPIRRLPSRSDYAA